MIGDMESLHGVGSSPTSAIPRGSAAQRIRLNFEQISEET